VEKEHSYFFNYWEFFGFVFFGEIRGIVIFLTMGPPLVRIKAPCRTCSNPENLYPGGRKKNVLEKDAGSLKGARVTRRVTRLRKKEHRVPASKK